MRSRTVLSLLIAAIFVVSACNQPPEPPAKSPAAPTEEQVMVIANAGFETPESILHDPARDLYLVSNINGSPAEKDDNGFISLVAPDGDVRDLLWIDGTLEEVTLHAPKGTAIVSGKLYVADIDTVRVFDAESGQPLDAIEIPGASFLNDVVANEAGEIFVSDSDTHSVHLIGIDHAPRTLFSDELLKAPNGRNEHQFRTA